MSIAKWPSTERPREKLLLKGPENLSDAELLAIFLRTGCRGKSAVDIARELLQKFGTLRNLLHCSLEEFSLLPGLGQVKFINFQAALELGKRYLEEKLTQQPVLNKTEDTIQFLTAKLRHLQHEVFACLFLDNHNKLIHYEEVSQGTHNQSRVYPREIVKRTLEHNAAAILFAHNHPSGISEASPQDIEVTNVLKDALALVDVDVLDHIIIGEGKALSFAERGWI